MKTYLLSQNSARALRRMRQAAAFGACLCFIGCATSDMTPSPEAPKIVQGSANFDTMLKHNQNALLERKGPQDLALYNIGLILSHPSNPKKDQPKALHSFKMLVAEHPRSQFADQAKTWIQVLEQQHKNEQERHRLLEEKRALSRERELLAQERQRLNFASEKSQQIDLEIEKRRRQSLSK
ncbi:MAG TPA: hypothetical protein VJQ55_07945 [Candidatus Binatia bacterium]|nr:hypothetical protein [Candidatus Binatia bacterium]